MTEQGSTQDVRTVGLTQELAQGVKEILSFIDPTALLADLSPSGRILGLGATHRQDALNEKLNTARATYVEWYNFWDTHTREFTKFKKIMGKIHAYIVIQKMAVWSQEGHVRRDACEPPTLQDLLLLSEETVAKINGVSLQDAQFVREAFGLPETINPSV